jgi:gentisate 1,2-dioxygenase
MQPLFLETNGFPPPSMEAWAPIIVKRADIEAHIARLRDEPAPAHGIRSMRIVHPQASNPGQGLAPTIACTIQVLKPGESTTPVRHNASEISFCLRGSGVARIGAKRIAFEKFSFWNTPAMHPFSYSNDTDEVQVRLSYSNAALLEMLGVHYVEHLSADGQAIGTNTPAANGHSPEPGKAARELPAPIPVGEDGAQLLTYEHLISPDVVPNAALHWPWKDIIGSRDRLFSGDALKNKGRRGLFMLYNPATTRTLGATHNLFATVGFMPGDTLDFPHRHSSSAINYCIEGGHISEVNGERVIWDEGDIAYTAPGWSAHANGSKHGGIAFTCQDHPFQMATESLIWQEGEGKPIRLLGAEPGFQSDDNVQLRGTH